ncbi:MAG: glycosyltransferase [Candidatus Micrarchaeia archaeon]
MEEIRVLFDFGASGRHHSLYDEILQAPPEGVKYTTPSLSSRRIPKLAVKAYEKVRSALDGKVDLAKYARKMNRAAAGEAGYDVVHLANHLDAVPTPFVADLEQAMSFLHARVNAQNIASEFAKFRQQRTGIMESSQCKFLLPWSEASAKSLSLAFPSEKVRKKVQVVKLAMRVPENHEPVKHEGFRALFLGSANIGGDWNFYFKGGRRVLRVFREFAKGKEDVELAITGQVPERERENLAATPKCRLTGLVSKEKMEELMRTSDVLFYPAYSTPGLAFIEAMRYHMPIVTTDAWANKEVVKDGVNGLVSAFTEFSTRTEFNLPPMRESFMDFELKGGDRRLDAGLLKNLDALYDSPSLRRKLGKNGFREVSAGERSIGVRNRKLREIYEQCLRK